MSVIAFCSNAGLPGQVVPLRCLSSGGRSKRMVRPGFQPAGTHSVYGLHPSPERYATAVALVRNCGVGKAVRYNHLAQLSMRRAYFLRHKLRSRDALNSRSSVSGVRGAEVNFQQPA